MSGENNDEDLGSDRSRSPMRLRQGLNREAVRNLQRDDIDSDDELEESAVPDPSNSRWPFSVHRTEQTNAGTSAGNMRWWSFLGSPVSVNLTAVNNSSPRWRSATTTGTVSSHQHNDQDASASSNAAVQRQRTVNNDSQRCFNSRISALFGRFLSSQSNSSSASTSTSASSSNNLVASAAELPHSSGYDGSSRLHASSSYLHLLQNDDEDATQSALPIRQRTRVVARNSNQLSASSNMSDSGRTELMINRIVRNGPMRYQLAAQQQRIAARMSQTGISAVASAASDSGTVLSTQRREIIATNRNISPLSIARSSRPIINEDERGSDEQEHNAGPSSESPNSTRTTTEHEGSAAPKVDSDATDDFQVRLRTAEQRFLHACEQVSLLNRQLERLQVRYEHACDRNQRAFRYTLRLRIAVVEGVRNMYYEYATQQTHEMTAIRCLVNSRSSRSSLQSIAL